jgi:hypothetical protein
MTQTFLLVAQIVTVRTISGKKRHSVQREANSAGRAVQTQPVRTKERSTHREIGHVVAAEAGMSQGDTETEMIKGKTTTEAEVTDTAPAVEGRS